MTFDILTEIYSIFEPFNPPAPEAYVDCQEVRGKWDVLRQLGREIMRSNQPTCQLFTGHRGVGKSTELLRLKQELEQAKYRVVYFGADEDDIEPQDTEYADILFACTRHLFQKIRLERTHNPLWQWAEHRWEELKSLAPNIVIKAEELRLEGVENPFAKISATLRIMTDKRQELRRYINANTPSLIQALNGFLAKAQQELSGQEFKGIVLIADNLDRIAEKWESEYEPSNYDDIFLNRSGLMRGLDCHVIYTVPISMVYSSRATRLEDTYGKPDVLPMVMVRNENKTENNQGLEKLREVIKKRLQFLDDKFGTQLADNLDSQVFESKEVVRLLCLMSGGHVRNLIQLIRIAIDWTDSLPITLQAVQIAVEEMRDTFRSAVVDTQWQILAEVYLKQQIENNEKHRQLLFNRCLLEYRYYDGQGKLKRWYTVHPLICDLDKFQNALVQVDSSSTPISKTDHTIQKLLREGVKEYQIALDQGDYDKVVEVAKLVHSHLEKVVDGLSPNQEEHGRIVALAEYWGLVKDLYTTRRSYSAST